MGNTLWGATPEEWALWRSLRPEHLLPTVCNPEATVSKKSQLYRIDKTTGQLLHPAKVPSLYNRKKEIAGIRQWAQLLITPAMLDSWQQEPDYGICVRTGQGLIALDCDSEDAGHHTIIEQILRDTLGCLPPCRFRENANKCLYLLNAPFERRKSVLRLPDEDGRPAQIELLATGQQFMAAGIHPSGARIDWRCEGELRPVDVSEEQLEAIETRLRALLPVVNAQISTSEKSSDDVADLEREVMLARVDEQTFEDLRSALWYAPVLEMAGPYSSWIDMGNRLAWFKGTEYEEQARELWLEWSATAPDGDIEAAAAKWDNDALKADRTGYQAIFKRAADNGWINPGSERMKHPVAVAEDFEDLGAVEHEEVKPPRSFPHTGGYGKPGRFLVEGLIPEGSTNVYGASSSFKSYFVISLLCRIAMKNHRWGGRNLKGGAVLYVAAEGGGSVMGRVGAWADKYNNGQPVPLFYTLPLAVDLSVPTNIKAMITEIKRISQATGEPVRIVAIDTLSQSMMQGEENNAGDMAKFIAGATKIYQETGASALIVHHSGKDARKGMRGSSAGFANVDAVIRVERLGEAVNLVNEKQRTGPAQPTRGYNVPAVPLPDEVIAANEAFDEEYTSTEGDVYDPVQLTTERVFEDVPLAEIAEGFEEDNDSEDDAGAKGSCDESWVWEKLEASGGGVNRSVLRELWKDETDKSMGQLRAVLGRMKEKCHIVEYGGVIRTSLGEDVPSGGGEIV